MSTVLEPTAADAAVKVLQIANGFVASSALNAIARLSVADHLAAGPLSITELAKKSGTDADALCRVLRMLCSIGIFVEVGDKKFANNDSSECLRIDAPNSQRDLIIFVADAFHFQAYADMVPTIRDGRTATEHVWQKNCFDAFAADKEEQSRFDNAMTNISRTAVADILRSFDFSCFGTLVDVAGGHGYMLTSILQKYPNMKGILFDLPHVVSGAKERIQSLGLSQRCEMVGGDFFKSVPAGDAIIMKHIIHDWDDEKAVAILKNCHQALAPRNGQVILVELLLSGPNEPHMSKFMDVEMLMLPGGRERTEQEYADLFVKSGFKFDKAHPVANSPYRIIVGKTA
jgi:hypothetical protein